MRIFEPHAHMSSRTTDDYEAMRDVGVEALVEPAFWLGQPRSSVGSFIDYFNSLIGWEPYRAAQFDIAHHCTIALNPKEANDHSFRDEVLSILPRYLAKDRVVGVGEIGYDSMTPEEDSALEAQLAMAVEFELPALVHTPHRNKLEGTKRTIDVVRTSGIAPERVLVDHNNELTAKLVLDSGCWAGFSIYPFTKMDEDRMVRVMQQHGTDHVIVNSAIDWGKSDPLKVFRTAGEMRKAEFDEAEISKVVWDNPVSFFEQSGRLQLDKGASIRSSMTTYDGNSINRGEPKE